MRDKLAAATDEGAHDAFDARQALDFAVRHKRFIASATALVVAATLLFLYTITPQYTATAQVLISSERDNPDSTQAPQWLDTSFVDSQVEVLQSRTLLRRVVEEHELTKDEEFGAAEHPSVWTSLRRVIFGVDAQAQGAAVPATQADSDAAVENAVEVLRDNMGVSREGTSYVLSISVTSKDRQKSADLANAVSKAYLVDQLEARFESARTAADWLSTRLKNLQTDLRTSEDAVEAFRTQNGLVSTSTGTITEQQLSELNAELATVRAATAEKRAKYEQAKEIKVAGGNLQALPDVLNSPVISGLRAQYALVTGKEADLVARYGERHPLVVNVRAERHDVEEQISAEVNRIVATLENDLNVAESREKSLTDSISTLSGETGKENQVNVRLRELERIAAANRAIYESFLGKAKIADEQSSFANQDSRIISQALVPGAPSFPQKKRFLALALVLGLGIGVGGAYLLDRLNSGFMTPRQVEEVLELPVLASVPRLSAGDMAVDGKNLDPPRYLLARPLSRYSEAVRTIRSGVQMSDVDHPAKIIQVTSAMPNEGKTTLAISIAFSLASAGHQVLLVDCDLRHPSTSRYFDLVDKPGVVDALTGAAQTERLVTRDEQSGAFIMSNGARSLNPPDLLSSERMRLLLAALREKYEYVILDSPPISPVVDSVVLSQFVDKVVLAVAWGSTAREAVAESLRQIPGTKKVAGVAFNLVDERRTSKYGRYAYYGTAYYGKYYTQ